MQEPEEPEQAPGQAPGPAFALAAVPELARALRQKAALSHGKHDVAAEMPEAAGSDHSFMQLALSQAKAAKALGEVPVGAVVVSEGRVVAAAHNRREIDANPSAHAEFLALSAAAQTLGRWRLSDCTVYVTLEPCLMCAGLMHQARITRCVYGAADPKAGALGSLYTVHEDTRLNHCFTVTRGVCGEESAELLSSFFALLRRERGTRGGGFLGGGQT